MDMPDKKLTIGIDASRLSMESTGVGRYTHALLEPLDKVMRNANFVLFAKRQHSISLPSERWSVVCDNHPFWSKLPVTFWIHYRLGHLIRGRNIDVLWATNSFIPNEVIGSVPAVVTVFDLRHVLYPRDMPPVTWLAHKFWFRYSVCHAQSVVAISQGTSDRMKHILGRSADVIARPSVPPLPIVEEYFGVRRTLAELGIRTPFFLTVGKSPCKNLEIVLAAVQSLKRRGLVLDHQLAMVGPQVKKGGGLIGETRANSLSWVKKLGRVTDEAMYALYSSADALVFPSKYEGFGIPVLEARSIGCRVITTDTPELREAGGSDAVYVEPTRDGVAAGIERALTLPRPPPSPVLGSNWDDCAFVMSDAFKAVARSSGQRAAPGAA